MLIRTNLISLWGVFILALFLTHCANVDTTDEKEEQQIKGGDPIIKKLDMHISEEDGRFVVRLAGAEMVRFSSPSVGALLLRPKVVIDEIGDGWQRVHMTWDVPDTVKQDELAVEFEFVPEPDFWWAPHLAPNHGDCMAQHVFRSPAIIAANGPDIAVVVPELELVGSNVDLPWFMDLDAPARRFWIGMSKSEVFTHVMFKKATGMEIPAGRLELGFFITAYRTETSPINPWKKVSRFLWDRYARPLYAKGEPGTVPLDTYVKHTYDFAFNRWKDAIWHEFEIDGQRVGGPAVIVLINSSPNYPGPENMKFPLVVSNQTWFSSMRTAAGLLRYIRRTGDDALLDKVELSKEFALAAPMHDGLFPCCYYTEMEMVDVEGTKVNKSKGWKTGSWTNFFTAPYGKRRNPEPHSMTKWGHEWYHVADMSWTCLLMLRWHDELETDKRMFDYAKTYAEKLITLQDKDGFFPAWIHSETFEVSEFLRQSPETSMSVIFLLKLAGLTDDKRYKDAAIKAMDAVLKEIVPAGRWEDYETYWSCCKWGRDEFVGKRIPRNWMYKQNSLSVFWTAEALLDTYRATGDTRYLDWGRRTLDELSMYQQVWQPPFIYVPALGGFSCMNADGEWNDARQSLFAELFMDYYKETGEACLFERGVAALKASFIMMYCPENAKTKPLWEKQHPFLGPEDYGFQMENYAHNADAGPNGEGILYFTAYTWGNGSGSEARNRIYDHYGDVYIDRKRGKAFGIDSISVQRDGDVWRLVDLYSAPREIKIVFDDGSSKIIRIDSEVKIQP